MSAPRLRLVAASTVALLWYGLPSITEAAPTPPVTAFVGVTVVPADREQVLPGHTVVVKGGRITAVGPADRVKVPAGATRIEGAGKFLMPGIAEMHGHIPTRDPSGELSRRWFALFVANGVTTVRGMQGAPGQIALREQIARGQILGPRLFLYGPPLGGDNVTTPASASTLVRTYKRAGFDGLKVTEGLLPPVFEALAKTAKAQKIPFGGHVSNAVGVERALALGQKSIEHLDGYVEALLPSAAETSAIFGMAGGDLALIDKADESKIAGLVAATKKAGAVITPTMVAWRNLFGDADANALAQLPELQYVPPRTREQWARGQAERAQTPVSPEQLRKLMALRDRLLSAMANAGGLVMLAADAPQRYNVPGFSLRHEMAAMVKAGLTPWQVVEAATTAPARYLGLERDFGTVAVGKRADLILIDGNPLEDVANIFRSSGVMANGRWLPRAELDALLAGIAADLRFPSDKEVQDFAIPAHTAAAMVGSYQGAEADQTFRVLGKSGGLFGLWSAAPDKMRRLRWQGSNVFLVPEDKATITAEIKDGTARVLMIKQDGAHVRWDRTIE
ncbi:MAG TPA: amidohydrolase family protein [Polyangia bacterium]